MDREIQRVHGGCSGIRLRAGEVASLRGLLLGHQFRGDAQQQRSGLGRIPISTHGLPLRSPKGGKQTRSLSPPAQAQPAGLRSSRLSARAHVIRVRRWRPHRGGPDARPEPDRVYMRAVSKTGARPNSSASAMASRLGVGTSRKIWLALRIGQQSRQNNFSGGPIVGNERADLVAAPARPNDTPGGEAAVVNQAPGDVPRRADPSPQELRTRCRKNGSVVRFHEVKRNLVQIQCARTWCAQ